MQLGRIKTVDIEQWLSRMTCEGLSPSRIRQAHQVLSASLTAAVRSQMLSRNPAAGVALPKKVQREMLIATPQEVTAIANAVPERWGTLVYILGYCGLRVGEAIALRRLHVNLLQGELSVAESATEVHGELIFGDTKNRGRRLVAVPQFLRHRLERHMDAFTAPSTEALVFTSTGGGPTRLSNFRSRIWKQALREAGVNPRLRIHDLRHVAASLLIAQGTHPKIIQEHLGHSSIAITMDRYGHLYPSARTQVAAALDDVYLRRLEFA
jgi:integrase